MLPVYKLLVSIPEFQVSRVVSGKLIMHISNTLSGGAQGLHFEKHCRRGTRKGVSAEHYVMPSFILSFNKLA